MRWLLLKDLRILRRSPLLVALLVIYPIAVATLMGLALSRGPDKPRVAFLNQVPPSANQIELGGEHVDASKYADTLFKSIDPVRVQSREEALAKVRSGDVLGALILPPDLTQKLQSGLEPPTIEIFYNAEDPVKARYVRDTIKSQVQDANTALTKKFTKVALQYLRLIATGGRFSIFGQDITVLGLRRSEQILRAAQGRLPRGARARAELEQVIRFARLARENLSLSGDVLATVGTPIRARTKVVRGGSTPLSSFAVAVAVTLSLTFVTLLLAAGTLALEREENAFGRLVRGLVTRTQIVVEKIGLAAICSIALAAVMLGGLGLFVDLDWHRAPLWIAALVPAAIAFAAVGVAIGAAAREVRAASLLAFMLALPLSLVSLVPSGAVSPRLYDAIGAVAAAFPFKPALDAMNAALNDSGSLAGPLLHLALLAVVFAALARVALRRFA